MTKDKIFQVSIVIWMILWLFFLVRQDKDGQYEMLGKLYRAEGEEKIKVLYGTDLYDFLVFCRKEIPEGSSFETLGFEEYSIDTVRARYFLWPLKSDEGKTDYKIVYSDKVRDIPGYKLFKRHGITGYIVARSGVS